MIADKQAAIDIINAQMQDMTYENVHLIHDFVININNSTPSKSVFLHTDQELFLKRHSFRALYHDNS